MIGKHDQQKGFALPTVLIAAVVMLMVLVSAVTATSSINSALDGQYYNRLASEAAESGIARASACLQESAFVAQWSDTNSLHPNTTCSGGAACTNDSSCFVMTNGNIRTSFTVGAPRNDDFSNVVVSVGRVELVRSSDGSVWRTYTYSASGRIGIDLNPNTVAFGYSGVDGGAFFGTIGGDGKVRAVGLNNYGQLGNGTTADTTTPTLFQLQPSDRAAALYTDFLSHGFDMFAITDKGTVYGAGKNDQGQLGDGTMTNRSRPVQFGLPTDAKATHVAVGGLATYVTTSDNRIYAAGECAHGKLGTDYPISGCANRSAYGLVALPTPTSDPNTIPTNNIVIDSDSVFVRMQGGRVYGWGQNQHGQLANGTFTDTSKPVQIGTYGDSGQPQAIDIATDGDTIYIVDSDGHVKGSGRNWRGELGGNGIPIYLASANVCLDNKTSNGVDLQFYSCNGTGAQKYAFQRDGSISNPSTGKCLENTNGDGVTMKLASCVAGAPKQQFVLRADDSIYNPATNECLDNRSQDGVTLQLHSCNGTVAQHLTLKDVNGLVDFLLPASAGKAVQVSTDQWFVSVLTDKGQVWSAGWNDRAQLGNGSTSLNQPAPVQFVLPAGVTATNVISSSYHSPTNDTFVIGSDGKVYGAGSNDYGQLGDGTTTSRSTPVAMHVIDGANIRAKQIQSGFGTTVVLTYGKRVYTVGNNSNGQLGDGTTTDSLVPKANPYTNVLPVAIF